MEQEPAAGEAVTGLLKAAGFTEHASRRRKRDLVPVDGFRTFTEQDGGILAIWVPADSGDPRLPASSRGHRKWPGRADGWTAEIGGLIWYHARMAKVA
jgi:hypothetical protein